MVLGEGGSGAHEHTFVPWFEEPIGVPWYSIAGRVIWDPWV